tara:strand:+ start:293 stop:886 length:594 start_codon:yes stop_codon:yes gene_type:complete
MAVIQLKRTEVASQQPNSADLDVGELAVNLTDGKLYSKRSNGSVIELLGGTAGDINISNITHDGVYVQGIPSFNTKQYILHGTTTTDAETELLLTGAMRIPVALDTTCFYEVSLVARRTDTPGQSGSWHLKGCADNFSDSVADVGDIYEISVAQDNLDWAVDIRASDAYNALSVYVTGSGSHTVRWTALVKTIEVGQ